MATIEIDGKKLEVEAGSMVIEAADNAGIVIPRFCYHKKLSVAANCRMCLVEVENGRNPMPACATPVTDGMKVFTKSKKALEAQKIVMEFLLINHPLDCPICDQGGECELQDVSMGYGNDISQYSEGKRSVVDDDLGPLIATEMTRCIHCTRCVRFGQEVAGMREMGATGRGEQTQIGTFVKHSVSSEVSGNIIDLCPVGALTSKPYRYSSRPWELTQHEQIASHDCLGSNTINHVRRSQVMRVLPNENEQVNETWLSDRDRFSYTGNNSPARLQKPMVKKNGTWLQVEWQEALNAVVAGFNKVVGKHGVKGIAGLCTPSATTEEAYLFQKFLKGVGINSVDHRVHQTDFADQQNLPLAPICKHSIEDIEKSDQLLLIGSNIQREQPLLGLRVRKAALNGGKVNVINPIDFDFNFDVSHKIIDTPTALVQELAGVVLALAKHSNQSLDFTGKLFSGIRTSDAAQVMADKIADCQQGTTIILGALANNHPNASTIRSLVHLIERFTEAKVYRCTEGANEAGCHIAGVLPHRGPAGEEFVEQGLSVAESIEKHLAGYFLYGLEAELDIASPHNAHQALLGAEFVTVVSSYKSDLMLDYADVLLPSATVFETSGTFVNLAGNWQSFSGSIACTEMARPAWKIFRVLGNLFELPGFEFDSTENVLAELKSRINLASPVESTWYQPQSLPSIVSGSIERIAEWPMYRIDSLCRHAQPLQQSSANDLPCIRVNSKMKQGLQLNGSATVSQGDIEITLPLVCDDRIPTGAVYVANAWPESSDLDNAFGQITLK